MRRITWLSLLLAVLAMPAEALSQPAVRMLKGAKIHKILSHDAIPSIDDPKFVSVEDAAAFMEPDELVLGISDGTNAKCYSTWLLESHELVNDWLGEVPVSAEW